MIRQIVSIDEDLCDGCGLCIPSCHEGALKIVDGKAKLVADNLCDGIGDCLGHCPRGAIKIMTRSADAYDEEAVQANRHKSDAPTKPVPHAGGCPGARFAQFSSPCSASVSASDGPTADSHQESQLTHWPVQLRLLPPTAPVLRGAKLLVTADCVPVACADFHSSLLKDHAVVMTCPKFDDPREYVDKLESMIRDAGLAEMVVARMEVPCCGGIVQAAVEAHRRVESSLPLYEVIISTRGEILGKRKIA